MSWLVNALVRLVVMTAGYLAAALAASAFIHLIVLGGLGWTPDQVPHVIAGSFFISVPLVALFVAYFAFVPAVIVIAIAEIGGIRDWLLYAIGGGIAGLCVFGLFWQYDVDPAFGINGLPSHWIAATLAGGGMVGGIAYWTLAGQFTRRRGSSAPVP